MTRWALRIAALIALALVSSAEAGVSPGSGSYMPSLGSGDYVLFGKYRHASLDASSRYRQEAKPTPVLWRVMEVDGSSNPPTAKLLSFHLLDAMAYSGEGRGPAAQANRWDGSDVQAWLNSSTVTGATRGTDGKTSARSLVKGFLHPDYFTAEERGVILPYPGEANDRVSLPSLWADDYKGKWHGWKYGGELAGWFGANDYDGNAHYGPGSLARRAHFKGVVFAYEGGESFGWPYWTRSPVASTARFSCFVDADGTLGRSDVNRPDVGVRPVLLLNLKSLRITAPNPSDLGFKPFGRPGGRTNPFLLHATASATDEAQ